MNLLAHNNFLEHDNNNNGKNFAKKPQLPVKKRKKSRLKKMKYCCFKSKNFTRISEVFMWSIIVIGFIWQTTSVSIIYFQYGTRVDIEMNFGSRVTLPGLTICLHLDDKSIVQHMKLASNLSHNQKQDQITYLDINRLAAIDTVNVKSDCKVPGYSLDNLASSDVDNSCDKIIKPVQSIHFNYLNTQILKCTTYFYQSRNQSPISTLLGDDKIIYEIDFISPQNHEVAVAIHNPIEILHYLEADTIYFNTSRISKFVLLSSRLTTLLLAAPYRTNCDHYHHLIMGRTGCIYMCRLKAITNCLTWAKSVPAIPPIKENITFRLANHTCPQSRTSRECTSESVCKNQCINYWYTTSRIWSESRSGKNDFNWRNQSFITRLHVRGEFNQGLELVYKYEANLDPIEYVCYIASLAGIWLGIAFIDAFRVCLNFMANYRSNHNKIGERIKKEKKKISTQKEKSINNFYHNNQRSVKY